MILDTVDHNMVDTLTEGPYIPMSIWIQENDPPQTIFSQTNHWMNDTKVKVNLDVRVMVSICNVVSQKAYNLVENCNI